MPVAGSITRTWSWALFVRAVLPTGGLLADAAPRASLGIDPALAASSTVVIAPETRAPVTRPSRDRHASPAVSPVALQQFRQPLHDLTPTTVTFVDTFYFCCCSSPPTAHKKRRVALYLYRAGTAGNPYCVRSDG